MRSELPAVLVIGNDLDVLRTRNSQAQLHGAADLLLLEYLFFHDLPVAAEALQDRQPDRVYGDPVRPGEDHIGLLPRAVRGPPVREGREAVKQDQGRLVGRVDLGDHLAHAHEGGVELGHVLLVGDADGELQGHGEDPAVAVGLEAAGGDDTF